MTFANRMFTLCVTLATCLGSDQATKRLATLLLKNTHPLSYLGDTLRIEYLENPGAFLGLGSTLPAWQRQALLTTAASLALAALMVYVCRKRDLKGLDLVGFALILAGGLSNLVNRVLTGVVVDFLNVGVGDLRTGIFNVADMAIMAGLAVIVALRVAPRAPANR